MATLPATINEPFGLSSYSLTQRTSKLGSATQTRKKQTAIYASYHRPSSNPDGFVTVAAQSDGVHILDVATLHPIISHTLGPSTTFACPPLTQHQASKNIHTTYAAIAASPEVDASNQGKTVWKRIENLSSPLADRASSSKNQRQAVVVPHLVWGLYDCDELPDRIIAISPSGDISALTADLEIRRTHTLSDSEDVELLQANVFPGSSCSFFGSLHLAPESAVVILALGCGDSIRIQVYCVGAEDSVNLKFTANVSIAPQEVAAMSCSPTGALNFISYSGCWHTLSLEPTSPNLTLSPISPPLQLTGLSFIVSPTPPSSKMQRKAGTSPSPSPAPCLLPLTSSHVLLASLSAQNEVVLLLWDTQYFLLLASHSFPLPQPLSSSPSSLVFSLLSSSSSVVEPGSQQAILVISQLASSADGKSPAKSSIYVVPYSVPARSTLASAMRHANAAKRWLKDSSPGGNDQSSESLQDVSKSKLLIEMRTSMEQNRPQAANTLFSEWEINEQEAVKEDFSKSVEFGYTFVKDVLEIVIQPQKPPNPLYSSATVRYLLEKGVVRSAMFEEGLLAALRARNDWQSVDLALHHVPDLSENELIETLDAVAMHYPSSLPSIDTADSNNMQVDPGPSPLDLPPSLPDFLTSLLKHRNFTAPQLILAFRRYLRGAEVATSIAHILDEWIRKVQLQETKLLPSKKDVVRNEHGVFILKHETVNPKSAQNLPSMAQILNFLQSLLDATFITLLQHPPAHDVLKSLKLHIEPEIATLSQTEQLRGLFEGFARAHAKAKKDGEAGATGGGKEEKKDWKQRRKEAHERAGMAVGEYQLEKLVL